MTAELAELISDYSLNRCHFLELEILVSASSWCRIPNRSVDGGTKGVRAMTLIKCLSIRYRVAGIVFR